MGSPTGVQTGCAPSGGAKIHYECAGAGPALVFVHAGVSDSRMWDPQFAEFAARHRVVRYDLRGFGKSPWVEEPYSNRDDLFNVMRHLGIARAAIVGCSLGGATAIDFALEHPAMVSGLVLVGSGASGLNNLNELEPDTIKFWTEYMTHIQKGEIDQVHEMEAKYWIDGPKRDAAKVDPVYRERARQLHSENFTVARMTRAEQGLQPPAIGRLGEIIAPTHVLVGENDGGDLIKLAHRLKTGIRGAQLTIISNAAHLPSLEHPDEFNSILREFLDAVLRNPERST